MIFKRKKYLDQLYSYLEKEKLIIIYGARQVGKTTLIKTVLGDDNIVQTKIYINFDDIYEKSFKTKNDFITYVGFNYNVDFYSEGILFLDEVQTIENIEQILKSLYDDDTIKLKIVATGSGLWQIKELGSSLVGRVKQIWVYPFSFYEFLEYKGVDVSYLTKDRYQSFMFDKIEPYLKEYYTFGAYPAVINENTKEDKISKLSEIIDIYLKKDVAFFLSGSEIINFRKIFSYLSNNISSILNINDLSSYLSISRDKVIYYLDILEKSFLLHTVFPFYSDSRKEYSKQPEFYLNDLGIINYFKNDFGAGDFRGELIENFAYLEILKNKNMFSDEVKTYNKINGSEIDFIYCYKVGGIVPIEIKLKNRDVIPKIFSSFTKNYTKEIKFLIKTTTSELVVRQLDEFDVYIIPFWMVGELV
ncbi:MAG: ATP-binding protein [Candidatus Gracilibacteria bacterium]|nr:ATP-binding protein [Candidatus Gracilibacteria bacterium]